jgi:hypothetical protein
MKLLVEDITLFCFRNCILIANIFCFFSNHKNLSFLEVVSLDAFEDIRLEISET